MTPDFVAITNAVWAKASSTSGWKTKSRILRHWSKVPAEDRPALMQAMCTPTRTPIARGSDAAWAFEISLYIYVAHVDGGLSPQELLGERLKVVCDAFDVGPVLPALTLGGLVQSCRIEGAIEMDDGWLSTTAVARVPIKIVA